MSSDAPISYDVEISGVQEVSLLGTAELGFWEKKLGPEGFPPLPVDGRAELMVSSTNAKFHGIPFRELSFSVFVSRKANASSAEGVYLVRAFNSVRFFAFVERTFFSTPYSPGDLVVESGPPTRVELRENGRILFHVETPGDRPSSTQPSNPQEDEWQGPLFLPLQRRDSARKFFYARLRGVTTVVPFDPERDVCTLTASPNYPVFAWLIDSAFTPRKWILRPDATHAKSKTQSVLP